MVADFTATILRAGTSNERTPFRRLNTVVPKFLIKRHARYYAERKRYVLILIH